MIPLTIKSIVFCDNEFCPMYCHISNISCHMDTCMICGYFMRVFCKNCALIEQYGRQQRLSDACSQTIENDTMNEEDENDGGGGDGGSNATTNTTTPGVVRTKRNRRNAVLYEGTERRGSTFINNSATMKMMGVSNRDSSYRNFKRTSHFPNNEGNKLESVTLTNTYKKYWKHLSVCDEAANASTFSQVCNLIDGYKVLEKELERAGAGAHPGMLEYKLKLVRSQLDELQTMRSKMQTEKLIKQLYQKLIETSDMNYIATTYFSIPNEETDRYMLKYLEHCLHGGVKARTNWFRAPIKLDTIYPKHGKYDSPTHVCIHATNCSQILHPDQIRIQLRAQDVCLDARIVSINKSSIRCIFPAVSGPIGAVRVHIESKAALMVNNSNPPIFYYLKGENKYVMRRHEEPGLAFNALNQSLAYQSIWEGNLAFLTELLSSQDPRPYLTRFDNLQRSMLHIACALNQVQTVQYLFALYGRYFIHLQLGDHPHRIFTLKDVNGCTIYTIAELHSAHETLSFLSQFVSDSSAMKGGNFDSSLNNLIHDYIRPSDIHAELSGMNGISSVIYRHYSYTFDFINMERLEMVLLLEKTSGGAMSRSQNIYKVSIMSNKDYESEILFKHRQNGSVKLALPGCEELETFEEANDRFKYFVIIFWCMQFCILPRVSHIQYAKQQLQLDEGIDVIDILNDLLLAFNDQSRSAFVRQTDPEVPLLNAVLEKFGKLFKCDPVKILQSLIM